jgi:hypothetical protein
VSLPIEEEVCLLTNGGIGFNAERGGYSAESKQRGNDRGFAEEHCDIKSEEEEVSSLTANR